MSLPNGRAQGRSGADRESLGSIEREALSLFIWPRRAPPRNTSISVHWTHITETIVESQLPFENGRTDLLTGSGSRLDIQNINLLATLLIHAQYQGYWNRRGVQFQEEMEALLERHVLNGLVDAPCGPTDDPESDDDDGFFAALQELVAYAFEESARIKKEGRRFPGWHEKPVRSSRGILQEVSVFASEVPQ